jgi:hypothetical protein
MPEASLLLKVQTCIASAALQMLRRPRRVCAQQITKEELQEGGRRQRASNALDQEY